MKVTIKAEEYGIESTKAQEIESMFKPMLEEMSKLEKEYNQIVKKPYSPELAQEARELRLKLVKVRTGTAKIHKDLKNYYLQAGRFIDGWKNAQAFASDSLEANLEKIEKREEIERQEKIQKLHEERIEILRKVDPDTPHDLNHPDGSLGVMDPDVWEPFLDGYKRRVEARKEEMRKAREEEAKIQIIRDRESIINNLFDHEIRATFMQLDDFPKILGEWNEKEFEEFIENVQKRQDELNAKREEERIEREKLLKEKQERERKLQEEREASHKLHADRVKKLDGLFEFVPGYTPTDLSTLNEGEFLTLLKSCKQAKKEDEEAEKARNQRRALMEGDDEPKMKAMIHDMKVILPAYEFKSNKFKSIQSKVSKLVQKMEEFVQSEIEKS